jgi:hypothetical protein
MITTGRKFTGEERACESLRARHLWLACLLPSALRRAIRLLVCCNDPVRSL